MRIFKRDLHLGNYRGKGRSGRSLNILSPYPTDPRHHHYVMRLKISRINIYLHIQRWGGGEKDLTKAHEAILKGRRTLIYFLALPHHHVAVLWNGMGSGTHNVVDLLRHVEKTRIARVTPSFRSDLPAASVFPRIYSALHNAFRRRDRTSLFILPARGCLKRRQNYLKRGEGRILRRTLFWFDRGSRQSWKLQVSVVREKFRGCTI